MRAVLEAVSERLMVSDEMLIRIPEICELDGRELWIGLSPLWIARRRD